MIDSPQIIQTQPEPYAFIHLRLPRPDIRAVLPPTLQELQTALKAQGIPIQPWFAHHLTLSDGDFNFEACFPVDDSFQATGRIQRGVWPTGTVARTIYHGDYPGLPAAWDELRTWIKQQGRKDARHIYERYLITSHTRQNSAEFRTELSWPLSPKVPESEQA